LHKHLSRWQPYNISVPLDLKVTCDTRLILNIYIRLKIKLNSVRIRSLSWQIFVLPSTECELTPLMHCSTIYNIYKTDFLKEVVQNEHSNMTSFFRFVDKRVIYRWYNLICTCAGECDWLFHWQHKLCAAFSASVNINCRFSIKVYYRICTLRHIKIEINHGSKNVFWVLTWVGGY
jgi:hypothetical protein